MPVADQIFRTLKLSQEIVVLYRDRLSNESLTGVITGCSDEFVYLSLFSETGMANGISVVHRNDITRMRWSGNERRSIAQLVEVSGAKPARPPIVLDSMQTILQSVRDAFGYINVMTERVDDSMAFIGEILDLDEDRWYWRPTASSPAATAASCCCAAMRSRASTPMPRTKGASPIWQGSRSDRST